jgi:hypothetical protein
VLKRSINNKVDTNVAIELTAQINHRIGYFFLSAGIALFTLKVAGIT